MTAIIDNYAAEPGHLPITIDRSDELEFIRQAVNRRRRRADLRLGVVVLHGSTGIGKSWFIANSLIPMLAEEFGELPRAVVDFDREQPKTGDRYGCRPGRGRLIIDLVDRLYESAGRKPAHEFNEVRQRWQSARDNWAGCQAKTEQAEEALADAELDLIGQFNRRVIPDLTEEFTQPVIVILDTVEEQDDKFIAWLQNSLQAPTTRYGSILWIMAGRFPIRAERYDLDQRYALRPLRLFTDEQIGRQLPGQRDLAESIRRLSHGLPGAAKRLAQEIGRRERELDGQLTEDDLLTDPERSRMVRALDDFVRGRRVLGRLNDVEMGALRLLSPLRLFNYTILDSFLLDYLPDLLGMRVEVDPEGIIERLQQARLVTWDWRLRVYIAEKPLRAILEDILEQTHPTIYDTVLRRAADLFANWYETIAEKRTDYLIQALYHRAVVLFRLDDAPDAFNQLRVMLAGAVATFYNGEGAVTQDEVDGLRRALKADEELREMMSPAEFDELLSVVGHRSGAAE